MEFSPKKYRLRNHKTIVGYAEETDSGMLFTGKYPLFWLNGQQKFNQVDKAIGILDKLHRMVYEKDIVSYKITDNMMRREGVVLWSTAKKTFGIFDLQSQHFTYFFIDDIFLFEHDKLEIISHLFNHPHLAKNLGLVE